MTRLPLISNLRNRRERPPTPWPIASFVAAFYPACIFAGSIGHRRAAIALDLIGAALVVYFTWFDGGDWSKRLGKKLKDSALTAVNAASFRRQSAEVMS